jgi:hypothetical protein
MPQRLGRRRRRGRGRGRNGPTNDRSLVLQGLKSDIKMPPPIQMPTNQVVRNMFGNTVSAVSDGFGIFAAALPCDPSATLSARFNTATLFTEWTNWANFYNEVRIIQFEVQLVKTYIDDSKGDQPGALAIASTVSPIQVVPSTYTAVSDNGDMQLWGLVSDYSGVNKYHAVKFKDVAWASVQTPNPGSTSGIVAGCPGNIVFYGSNYPATTQLFYIKVRGLYEFRHRI